MLREEIGCYTLANMRPAKNHVLVELHVADFEEVKEFYGRLGFQVVRETRPKDKEGYLVLEMEENILCFWAGNEQVYEQSYFKRFPKDTKRGYDVEVVIMVADLEAYFSKVQGSVKIITDLALRPWGLKDFRVEDPFGYYLRITSVHNILDDRNAPAG
jgi:uncharacterized glyoxalase superfamily protein PhnB